MKIYGLYYNLYYSDLITSLSLICKLNYTTSSNKRLTKIERSQFKIENPLSEIIIGLLLGDGHIQQRNKNSRNSRFIYAQSSLRENHYNYFKHISELFKPYLSNRFNLKSKTFLDKRSNKIYSSVSFSTLTLPCFTYYKELFYNSKNKKIVPLNIKELLTPRGLAY